LEVTALIKQGLRDRLEQKEKKETPVEDAGFFSNVYAWFMQEPEEVTEQ